MLNFTSGVDLLKTKKNVDAEHIQQRPGCFRMMGSACQPHHHSFLVQAFQNKTHFGIEHNLSAFSIKDMSILFSVGGYGMIAPGAPGIPKGKIKIEYK
jgi:hypothetical protein